MDRPESALCPGHKRSWEVACENLSMLHKRSTSQQRTTFVRWEGKISVSWWQGGHCFWNGGKWGAMDYPSHRSIQANDWNVCLFIVVTVFWFHFRPIAENWHGRHSSCPSDITHSWRHSNEEYIPKWSDPNDRFSKPWINSGKGITVKCDDACGKMRQFYVVPQQGW